MPRAHHQPPRGPESAADAHGVPPRSGNSQIWPPSSVSMPPSTAGASELSSDDESFFSCFLASFASFFFFFSISLWRFAKLYWFLAKSVSVHRPLRVEKHETHEHSTSIHAHPTDCTPIGSISHAISAILPPFQGRQTERDQDASRTGRSHRLLVISPSSASWPRQLCPPPAVHRLRAGPAEHRASRPRASGRDALGG